VIVPGPGAALLVAMPSRRAVPNVMVPVEGRVDRNCRPSVSCGPAKFVSRPTKVSDGSPFTAWHIVKRTGADSVVKQADRTSRRYTGPGELVPPCALAFALSASGDTYVCIRTIFVIGYASVKKHTTRGNDVQVPLWHFRNIDESQQRQTGQDALSAWSLSGRASTSAVDISVRSSAATTHSAEAISVRAAKSDARRSRFGAWHLPMWETNVLRRTKFTPLCRTQTHT
jgi:hypothetical protein